LPADIENAEEMTSENGWISNFEGLVTMTLTLDRVILHTVMHHSSTSTYKRNVIEIKKSFLWADGHTYARTDGWTFETSFIRSTLKRQPKNEHVHEMAL